MQPRMLTTFDEELRPLPVPVRVGQVRLIKLFFIGSVIMPVFIGFSEIKKKMYPSKQQMLKCSVY